MSFPAVLFWLCLALVAYAYVGFPLLLAMAARGRPQPQPPEVADADLPQVAMIVAAHNEAAVLPAKLRNTWALDYPADRLTLWVGSDGCTDDTAAVLAVGAHPRLHGFAFPERRGKISVLNDLVALAPAEILVMSDANTMFEAGALRRLVRHFREAAVGCVSGQLLLEQAGGGSGEGLYWRYEAWIKRNESRLGFLIGCNGGIYALRRILYQPLPAETVVEDFVLTMRVLEGGHQVRLEPAAIAFEPPTDSARAEMVRKVRIGAGGYQALGLTRGLLHPRHGLRAFAYWGHKVLRWLAPVLLTIALVCNLTLLHEPPYPALLGAQFLGIALAYCAYRSRTPLPAWTRPVSYFYLMNYALLCGLIRYLGRAQQVTWERASR